MHPIARTLFPALFLALLPPALAAQAVVGPDHPHARQAREAVELINRGDAAALAAFVERHFHPEHVSPGAAKEVEALLAFRHSAAPLAVQRFEETPRGDVAARFTERAANGATGMVLVREPREPQRIVSVAPMMPPPLAPSAGTGQPLDAATRRAVVDTVASLVERLYVAADTASIVAGRLRRREREGAYARLSSPAELARALTADLQSVNGDKHLNVRALPGPQQGAARRTAGADAGENHGFEEARLLEGNVGYVRLSRFSQHRDAYAAAERALRAVEGADAVVFDVRGVPGGSGDLSTFLISHFTAADVPLLARYDRATGETVLRRTLAEVPGPRRTGVPLYVLVDGASFSAAEAFAFTLQSLGRATVVGERTGGGGRNNQVIPLGAGLVLSVSISRVYDPKTGKGWEGTGVRPDLAAPSGDALARAVAAAREAVAAGRAPQRTR